MSDRDVAQGWIEGSFDFDFIDLPLDLRVDLVFLARRVLAWRDDRNVVVDGEVAKLCPELST